MKKYLKLLRVEQWVKNTFVFLPIFFSGHFISPDFLVKSIFAFIIFSLTASSVYILNDYLDIEADRKHPEKCKNNFWWTDWHLLYFNRPWTRIF